MSEEEEMSEESTEPMNEESKLVDEEKQSTNFDLLCPDPISLEWRVANPKKELLCRLKSIASNEKLPTDD